MPASLCGIPPLLHLSQYSPFSRWLTTKASLSVSPSLYLHHLSLDFGQFSSKQDLPVRHTGGWPSFHPFFHSPTRSFPPAATAHVNSLARIKPPITIYPNILSFSPSRRANNSLNMGVSTPPIHACTHARTHPVLISLTHSCQSCARFSPPAI